MEKPIFVQYNQTYQIEFTVASADGDYNGFTLTPVEITNSDDDSAGITAVATDATTDESGGTATFTVRLNTQPTANVTVTPTSSDTTEGTVSEALTFTAANWNTAQTITVTGVDDSLVDGNQTYQISFAVASTDSNYNEFTLTPVDVTNSDDDYSATIVATTQAAEPSTDGVFTISLDRNAPTAGITVNYDITGSATAGDDYATLPGNATITVGSSTGTVVVDVTDDSIDDDAETVVLTLTGGSAGTVIVGSPATATVTITDDDSAGITAVATDATTDESGETATITVRLNTQPSADVTVTPTSSDTDEGTVSGALTFSTSNWGTEQTITVTGVDDTAADGDQTYQISFAVTSTDSDYDGFTLTPVEVTNSDDDYSATIVATTQAAEPSTDGVFTISLDRNAPTGGVTVNYDITGSATAGDDYATLPGSATIAAGSSTGTVVVDVTDDALNDDAETVVLTLTGGSAGTGTVIVGSPATATVTITDEGNYDTDNDGLIEVRSLAQLNAIRYDLTGDGAIGNGNYDAAYPDARANMGCPSTCTGYELMNDLDFDTDGDGSTHTDGAGDADDAYYNGGSGWEPIGTLSDSYTATFEGNSNTIDNLFINRSSADYIGLFGRIAPGEIKNIGVVDVYVTGNNRVGGLVGSSSGTISASYATGAVTGDDDVGGLVGDSSSTISASYATGAVTGSVNVGGLVGDSNRFRTISASYATGAVNGNAVVGGLVGWNGSTISASYATGDVIGGNTVVGGLVGYSSSGTISASYATGAVTGKTQVGGLVGVSISSNTISASYATGAVTGGNWVGGLVGDILIGTISASYATGAVTGDNWVGGLVGRSRSSGTISASYATGAVTGDLNVGGLVGESNNGTISASYATGAVTGSVNVGGLVGWNTISSTISASYSDSTTTGQSNPVGFNSGTLSDVSALTTAQLQSPVNYTGIYASWNVDIDNADGDNNAATGGDTPWHFAPSTEYPALLYDVDGNGSLDIFGPQR